MIWAASPGDPLYPAVRIFRLGMSESDATVPEVRYNHSEVMNLVIVGASADTPDEVDRALAIAAVQDATAITVAVMTTASLADRGDLVRQLRTTFGAVFLVDPAEQNDRIERIVKMIITPGSAFHPWCFDWSDMCYFVTQGDRTRPVRYGSARATGSQAASQAAVGALRAMHVATDPIGDGLVLFLVTLSKQSRPIAHREVAQVIRQHLGEHAYYGSGIFFDDELPADEVGVDLYRFGENLVRRSTSTHALATAQTARKLTQQEIDALTIPDFLRRS